MCIIQGKKASLNVPLNAHRNGGTGDASESIGIGAKYGPSKDLLFLHAPPGFCQSLYRPQTEKIAFYRLH